MLRGHLLSSNMEEVGTGVEEADEFGGGVDAELAENVVLVGFDGALGYT